MHLPGERKFKRRIKKKKKEKKKSSFFGPGWPVPPVASSAVEKIPVWTFLCHLIY